jgi:hypothetical protein
VGILFEQVQDPLLEWLTKGGPLGILAVGVIAFVRGWIVSGTEHKRVRDELDRALELLYRHAGLATRAIDVSLDRMETEAELFDVTREGRKEPPPRQRRKTLE